MDPSEARKTLRSPAYLSATTFPFFQTIFTFQPFGHEPRSQLYVVGAFPRLPPPTRYTLARVFVTHRVHSAFPHCSSISIEFNHNLRSRAFRDQKKAHQVPFFWRTRYCCICSTYLAYSFFFWSAWSRTFPTSNRPTHFSTGQSLTVRPLYAPHKGMRTSSIRYLRMFVSMLSRVVPSLEGVGVRYYE